MAVEYSDRYSVQQSILEDQETKARNAIADAVNLAGTKGAGMMYEAVSRGEREGQFYADLGNMLTGQGRPVDPRLARQDALEAIFNRHGHPDSYEDMVAIANDLRASGFPDEADLAMKQANDYQKTLTDALKAQTSSTKAPTREDSDYLKMVNGKEVIYTKTEEWQPSTKTWKLVSEAPKYGPDKPTATMQDMMFHASKVQNADGTVGCDLDDPACWIKATELYHATTVKESSFSEEFGEAAGKDISEQLNKAKTSVGTITTIDASFNALNSGDPITGFAANMRLGLAKMIGAITGDESRDIQATEVWLATTGKLVAELLASGAFGSGTGLSDNDVKFAKGMVAGDIELDEGSIRRILYIRRQLEIAKINQWNKDYETYPQKIRDNINLYYTDAQVIQPIAEWPENQIFMRPPDGFFIYQDKDYFWPATEWDVDTVTVDGKQWTIHNKNGFDITAQYIASLPKE